MGSTALLPAPRARTKRIARLGFAVIGADGVVPDGVTVSAFDEQVPAVGMLDPDLLDVLRAATADAQTEGVGVLVNSGWRSPDDQEALLTDAVAQYGSHVEAARWVATTETSAVNHAARDGADS